MGMSLRRTWSQSYGSCHWTSYTPSPNELDAQVRSTARVAQLAVSHPRQEGEQLLEVVSRRGNELMRRLPMSDDCLPRASLAHICCPGVPTAPMPQRRRRRSSGGGPARCCGHCIALIRLLRLPGWWTEEDIIETTIGLVTGRRALIASPNGRGTRGAFRRGHRRRLQRRNSDVLEPHGGKQGKAREST